jgi:hypothetical protein
MGNKAQTMVCVAGTIHDAVILPEREFCCEGCDLRFPTCALVGCVPMDRADGRFAIWKRRVTNTPVEASL